MNVVQMPRRRRVERCGHFLCDVTHPETSLSQRAYHRAADILPPILWPVVLFPWAMLWMLAYVIVWLCSPARWRK